MVERLPRASKGPGRRSVRDIERATAAVGHRLQEQAGIETQPRSKSGGEPDAGRVKYRCLSGRSRPCSAMCPFQSDWKGDFQGPGKTQGHAGAASRARSRPSRSEGESLASGT